jgi:hypothetical protein
MLDIASHLRVDVDPLIAAQNDWGFAMLLHEKHQVESRLT